MNQALVFDLNEHRARIGERGNITLGEALQRIERCGHWLAEAGCSVLAVTATTLHDPVIVVAAHPKVWMLFSGRAERKGYKQDGALRHEVWEGKDRIHKVNVRWQEVMACA